jgi:hypothetical protein
VPENAEKSVERDFVRLQACPKKIKLPIHQYHPVFSKNQQLSKEMSPVSGMSSLKTETITGMPQHALVSAYIIQLLRYAAIQENMTILPYVPRSAGRPELFWRGKTGFPFVNPTAVATPEARPGRMMAGSKGRVRPQCPRADITRGRQRRFPGCARMRTPGTRKEAANVG